MTKMKVLLVAMVLTAAFAVVPSATAQCPFNYAAPPAGALPCVHFMGAGSSAMYQQTGVEVVDIVAPSLVTANITPLPGTADIHHYTTKSTCGTGPGGNCVSLVDTRTAGIPDEQVQYWIVWVTCTSGPCAGFVTDEWAYNQVDSTVGDRAFLAQGPKVQSALDSGIDITVSAGGNDRGQDLIDSRLLSAGVAGWPGHGSGCNAGKPNFCDDEWVPDAVFQAANNAPITTGMTDIRAEDGVYATARLNCAQHPTLKPWDCLNYHNGGNPHVATAIASSFTTATANPVDFGLPGTLDPITGAPVPSSIESIAIGEAPIIFVTNRSNAAGLGTKNGAGHFVYDNVIDNTGGLIDAAHGGNPGGGGTNWLGYLFGGNDCAGDNGAFGGLLAAANFPVVPILREGLSGTMNTVEFSTFKIFGGALGIPNNTSVGNSNTLMPNTSQEANIDPANANNNPLNLNCVPAADSTTGHRVRAIGTGEEIRGNNSGLGGVKNIGDSIGYAFFSFGNVSPLAGNVNFGYLKLDGVDPIFSGYTVNGLLPSCTPGACNINTIWGAGNSPFPHLADGTYRSWSVLRAYCDKTDGHCRETDDAYGTEGIIDQVQQDLAQPASSTAIVDFLPLSAAGVNGGYGLANYLRSHYVFNPNVGITNNLNPHSHNDGGVGPVSLGPLTDLGMDFTCQAPAGGPKYLEVGGDAGGAIIPVSGKCLVAPHAACTNNQQCTANVTDYCQAPGGQMVTPPQVLNITKYLVAPVNHLKYTYTEACGPHLTGVCTGGANNGTVCITATPTGAGAPPGATCTNSPGQFTTSCSPQGSFIGASGSGISMSVSGSSINPANGVFQVTKIVGNTAAGDANSAVKVKMSPNTNSATNCANYGAACSVNVNTSATATISTGASQ